MTAPKPVASGFTLVEMLVALAIFSLISVAGVALLQSASTTQVKVKQRLGEMSGDARAISILEADLAQAVARPVRSTATVTSPAFAAHGSEAPGQIFAFSRLGWSNFDGSARGEMQRVIYAVEGGTLKRTNPAMPDGGRANSVILLKDISSIAARFRDAEGNWRSDWDANDPLALPRAVELLVTQQQAAPVRMLFLVGTAQPAKKIGGDSNGEAP
jgi:general secretion pathway protein J